ncbi:response regulator [Shewanella eurypsychrophilus]|uniref:Response regulator n=1 Tax=Shewanella eurypsychrophilus TaxID=2593656 RepID=A0ABX6V7B1_9GAMM|nr:MULTISPECIES: response regulator [Shewanella]QFU22929.1 response regulator [Shewanella sp. YLB-09]QPG58215.1 response regulator [Shewanella eurypsychrophilus]
MSNILIIDDDEDFCEALKDSISLLLDGEQISLCNESSQIFNLIESRSVDLVITDMVMPDVEGIEIITRLKQEKPQLPIIAMSGGGRVGGNNYLMLAETLGADAIFEKPLSIVELTNKVKALLVANR